MICRLDFTLTFPFLLSQILIFTFDSDCCKPLSKEVKMQTMVTNQSTDPVNLKITKVKSNKCSHCDYASSRTGNLRTHMKTHTGEKSNKCSLCDYASSRAGDLRTHIKNTLEKSPTNATCVTMHHLR